MIMNGCLETNKSQTSNNFLTLHFAPIQVSEIRRRIFLDLYLQKMKYFAKTGILPYKSDMNPAGMWGRDNDKG